MFFLLECWYLHVGIGIYYLQLAESGWQWLAMDSLENEKRIYHLNERVNGTVWTNRKRFMFFFNFDK